MERRFQFGLKNLLRAMTWMAVWFGAWSMPSFWKTGLPNVSIFCFFIIYQVVFVAAPFAAIGALLGRMKLGILIGCIVATVLALPVWSLLTRS